MVTTNFDERRHNVLPTAMAMAEDRAALSSSIKYLNRRFLHCIVAYFNKNKYAVC
jgi:hypothetical protein